MLLAGFSRVDITPPLGEELAGYPHYPRNNTGVHDPLFAVCLYLNDGICEIAMVTLDILFFSKKHVQTVRKRASETCGIPGNCIMISCSHTHSGPWASGRLDIESLEAGKCQSAPYIHQLTAAIVEAISDAKKHAFEAELVAGTEICGAEVGVGGNRRIPGGPHDPLVSVIAVRNADKVIRGAMVNYSLHPTFIHEWSTVVTADYPCYLKRKAQEEWPDAIIGFAQGASGNQSSRYYRHGESYDEAQRVGELLGSAACRAIEHAQWQKEAAIKTASAEVEITLREFGNEAELERQVAEDRANYEALFAKYGKSDRREDYYLWQNANLKMLGTEDQLGYVRLQKRGVRIELLEDEQPAEIQVIRIGDLLVVGCPGEVFVEYGLYIKAMAGFDMVIFNELTNGCLPGYLYTPQSLATGGYETDTSMLSPSFGRYIVDAILDLVESVKN